MISLNLDKTTIFRFQASVIVLLLMDSTSFSQTTAPVTDADALTAINKLRAELVDAFNKKDLNRLVSHLDDDVLVTWQNGEVSQGPNGVRTYYNKMMGGTNPVVSKLSADPVVDNRHIYGDWAVSSGNLNDHYELKDGTAFDFNSRFSAVISRRGAEWKVTAFHASVNAFDNGILRVAVQKVGTWAGIGAGVIGLIVGVIIGAVVARRKSKRAVPATA